MNRESFINQATERLNEINIPYRVQDSADIAISGTFKKEDDDSAAILYAAFFFFNQKDNTVYAYERAMLNGVDISKDPSYGEVVVKDQDDDQSLLPLGIILTTLAGIAVSLGANFKRTDDERLAKYPIIPVSTPAATFCTNCGAKMPAGTRFCSNCGADSKAPVVIPQPKPFVQTAAPQRPFVQGAPPPMYPQQNFNQGMPPVKLKKKSSVAVTIIVVILVIGILVGAGWFIWNWLRNIKSNGNNDVVKPKSSPTSIFNPDPGPGTDTFSAVVSEGESADELGNIANSPYYFRTEDYIFYSCYDENNKAHIYRVDRDGKNFMSIFDGFGWSLLVIDNKLYFCGNQGDTVDDTYNMFRMNLDGSGLETIVGEYCKGLFKFGDYLYYFKRNVEYSHSFDLYRSKPDGSAEEQIYRWAEGATGHKNYLYFLDNQGNMFKCNPDGTNKEVILQADADIFLISNGKIVYMNQYYNYICTMDLDGNNNTRIKTEESKKMFGMNAYNGRIYYIAYDPEFKRSTWSWSYDLVSMNFDGSDEKIIYSGASYGMYLNVVGGRVMVLDFKWIPETQSTDVYINSMNPDGSDLKKLQR